MTPGGWDRMNELGSRNRSFLFIVDFDLSDPLIFTPEEANNAGILFQINDIRNFSQGESLQLPFSFRKDPVSLSVYKTSFDRVIEHINLGNSYLVNLTFPTLIDTDLTLSDIFFRSRARYKLLIPERFVVFSPEIFIQIHDGIISSNPMKGTIDASDPNAEKVLIGDPKELAEQYTIVDLIRNDLNMVAKEISVEKFRYVERIETNLVPLLQISSRIIGKLPDGYHKSIGNLLRCILPAGSVTGAPKKRTVEIIRETEIYKRGYYTGVMGFFNGSDLDSGVMIRFIEQEGTEKIFKSGGGITSLSNVSQEYQEMIDKVYVPFI